MADCPRKLHADVSMEECGCILIRLNDVSASVMDSGQHPDREKISGGPQLVIMDPINFAELPIEEIKRPEITKKIKLLREKRSAKVNPKSRTLLYPTQLLDKLKFLSNAVIRREGHDLSMDDLLSKYRIALVKFFCQSSFSSQPGNNEYQFKIRCRRSDFKSKDARNVKIRITAKSSEYDMIPVDLKDTICSAVLSVGKLLIKTYIKKDHDLIWDIALIDELNA